MRMKSKSVLDTRIRIPEKVPVFPLPNLILFPGIEIPLYVFEPRYRKMLKDCLEGSKFMAISLFRKGWEVREEPVPSHPVVGVGYVRAIFENPDGTSYMLLKGVTRARILRYVQRHPYPLARVREIPDLIEETPDFKRSAGELRELLAQKLKLASENPLDFSRMPKEFSDPVRLSHLACFFSDATPYQKQALFETPDCHDRIRQLIPILSSEIHPTASRN